MSILNYIEQNKALSFKILANIVALNITFLENFEAAVRIGAGITSIVLGGFILYKVILDIRINKRELKGKKKKK